MDQILKVEMGNLKEQMDGVSNKVDEIYYALLGNTLTKDGGLIGRVIQLETDKKVLEKRVEVLESEKKQSDIYVKILWAAGGVVCTMLLTLLLNYLFKK